VKGDKEGGGGKWGAGQAVKRGPPSSLMVSDLSGVLCARRVCTVMCHCTALVVERMWSGFHPRRTSCLLLSRSSFSPFGSLPSSSADQMRSSGDNTRSQGLMPSPGSGALPHTRICHVLNSLAGWRQCIETLGMSALLILIF